MFITPSGTPARLANCPQRSYCERGQLLLIREMQTSVMARHEYGVSGGGLMTAVQPAARAAPSLRVIMAEGKFHGVRIDLFFEYQYVTRCCALRIILHDA